MTLDRFLQGMDGNARGELVMAINRICFGSILFFATWCASLYGGGLAFDGWQASLGVWCLASACVLADVVLRRKASPLRRLVALCLDVGGGSVELAWAGPSGAFIAPSIFAWVILGNGLRFGTRAIATSTAFSLIGFGIAVLETPYWRQQPSLAIGAGIGLVILPLYGFILTRQVAAAKEAAEQATRSKDLFLASVSHELRTPLQSISGAADLLRSDKTGRDRDHLVSTLRASSEALLGHVEGLLNFSRLEAGQFRLALAPFALDQLVAQSVAMIDAAARHNDISLSVQVSSDVPLDLVGDASRIRDVLLNLLGNATKFTTSSCVLLSIGRAPAGSSHCRIRFEVRDTGPGIPIEAQRRIFDRFTQVDETAARRFGGIGLGLALCDRIVAAMGGTIGVHSQPGEGTTFWFELDLPTVDTADESGLLAPIPAFCQPNDGAAWAVADRIRAAGASVSALPPLSHQERFTETFIALADAPHANASWVLMARAAILVGQPSASPWPPDWLRNTYPRMVVTLAPDALPDAARRAVRIARSWSVEEAPPAEPDTPPSPPVADRRRIRVLVADDTPANGLVARLFLERAGFTVVSVSDGESALDALVNEEVDAAFLDVGLPDINGVMVMQQYRCVIPTDRRVPVLGITADGTEDTRKRCLDAGMAACLIKPVSQSGMIEALDRAMRDRADSRTGRGGPGQGGARSQGGAQAAALDDDVLRTLSVAIGASAASRAIEVFQADGAAALRRIQSALEWDDHRGFRHYAHVLRGVALSLGARRVGDACDGWERLPASMACQIGSNGLPALKRAWDEACEALRLRSGPGVLPAS